MANTRPESLLSLGRDVLNKTVAHPAISLSDFASFSCVCKSTNQLFKPKMAAAKLLKAVIAADEKSVIAILSQTPKQMFELTKGTDINGNNIYMSAIHYAAYVNNPDILALLESCAQREDKLEEYLEHLVGQKQCFDYAPFFNLHQQFEEMVLQDHSEQSEENMKQYSQEILGGSFLTLLPRHILKRMCAKFKNYNSDIGWCEAKIDYVASKDQCLAYDDETGTYIDVLDFSGDGPKLGKDFTLYRGYEEDALVMRGVTAPDDSDNPDLAFLASLIAEHHNDLQQRIELIQQEVLSQKRRKTSL